MSATECIQQQKKKVMRCYWCDVRIHFNKEHVTKDGHYLPVLDNGKIHDCKEKKRIMKFNRMAGAAGKINKYTNRQFW